MKKSIIAAGAASVALAAMPILGAMAADITVGDVVDDIHVVISDGCTITRTGTAPSGGDEDVFEREVTISLAAGEKDSGSTPGFTVTCSKAGWTVSAEGTGDAGSSLTDSATPTAHTIATGTTLSGSTSEWAMKVAATNATIADNFGSDHIVPSSAALVATGTTTSDTITPTYTVFAAADQVAGTYEGQVTYSVVLPE